MKYMFMLLLVSTSSWAQISLRDQTGSRTINPSVWTRICTEASSPTLLMNNISPEVANAINWSGTHTLVMNKINQNCARGYEATGGNPMLEVTNIVTAECEKIRDARVKVTCRRDFGSHQNEVLAFAKGAINGAQIIQASSSSSDCGSAVNNAPRGVTDEEMRRFRDEERVLGVDAVPPTGAGN